MPLIINGKVAKPTRPRWGTDEAPVEPIRVPLEQSVIDALNGVTPEDAWLPLCIALVNRLHRLWSVAASGLYLHARPLEEEHLFQVMRRSLEALCPDLEEDESLAAYLIYVPGGLPPSGHFAVMSAEVRTSQIADFQQIERGFINDAIERGINPDPRTVVEALVAIDAPLDRILLHHDQTVLKHADQLGLSIHMQEALRRSIRNQYERLYNSTNQYLAIGLEAVDRLRKIWTVLYPDTSSLRRYPNDEQVYQGYRDILLRGLRTDPAYATMLNLTIELLPSLLPLTHELKASNPLFREMPARFERLHNELIAGATALGEPTIVDYPNEPDLDVMFEELDWEWGTLQETVAKQRQKMTHQVGGKPLTSPVRRRVGRPRASVTYEQAVRAWWDCFDDLKSRPSQPDVCDRLRTDGIHISERTLRDRIDEWEKRDLRWPPARPAE